MLKQIKIILTIFIFLNCFKVVFSAENFFIEGQKKYDEKKFEDSKFLLQRNIVFNPKDANSYLYLAKIFNFEKNDKEELKNLNTTLLLEPNNEEAIYMLIGIKLKKSNYSEVKTLLKKFSIVCTNLCKKTNKIKEDLKNIEPKDES
jgi:tetratricopeptide (TPR) repeat protein